MKILLVTQKVDINDPILGFFHRWIIEFSKNFENVNVICLEKGKIDLPSNVSVFSLGKESSKCKLKYIFNFFKYIIFEKKNYDAVFVHMNQEYILLGGLFWKVFGKKVYMWRNHYSGGIFTDLASIFCKKIFCTSRRSFTAKYDKTVLMPVGIDTNLFVNKLTKRKENSVLSIGRLSPSKRVEVLIKALSVIKKHDNVFFSASIYGNFLPSDSGYVEHLKDLVIKNSLENNVKFLSPIPNYQTPDVYSSNEIFINLSPDGMFDKTIFEAMSCECLVVVSNSDLKNQIGENFLFKSGDHIDLSNKIEKILKLNEEEKLRFGTEMREYVVNNHSLSCLFSKLKKEIL